MTWETSHGNDNTLYRKLSRDVHMSLQLQSDSCSLYGFPIDFDEFRRVSKDSERFPTAPIINDTYPFWKAVRD